MAIVKKSLAALLGLALAFESGPTSWAHAAKIVSGPLTQPAFLHFSPTTAAPLSPNSSPRDRIDWEDHLRAYDAEIKAASRPDHGFSFDNLELDTEQSLLGENSSNAEVNASHEHQKSEQEIGSPRSEELAAIKKWLSQVAPQSGRVDELLTEAFDNARVSNPGIYSGDTVDQGDRLLVERIREGQAWKVWSRSKRPSIQGDIEIPYIERSLIATQAAGALEQARQIMVEHERMAYEPERGAVYWMDNADIVVVAQENLLLQVGKRRGALYVGSALWERLLRDPPALAALLENGLYQLAYPGEYAQAKERKTEAYERWKRSGNLKDYRKFLDADRSNSEFMEPRRVAARRMAEAREHWIDPSGGLRRTIAELAVPATLSVIGLGSQARLSALVLREAFGKWQSLDFLDLMRAQLDKTAPQLRALWEEWNTRWQHRRDLARQEAQRLQGFDTRVSIHQSYVFEDFAEQMERNRKSIEPWRTRLNMLETCIYAEQVLFLDARQYVQILGELLGMLSVEEGPEARQIYHDAIGFTLRVAERLLHLNPLYDYLQDSGSSSEPVRRFMGALREESGVLTLRTQTHEADLYGDPGLMAFGVFLRTADGGLLFSVHRRILEYWLSTPGRKDLARRLGLKDEISAMSDARYARFIASALLRKIPWESGAQNARTVYQALLKSGAAVLERAFYARLPDLEAAYKQEKIRTAWRWGILLPVFVAAAVIEYHLIFVAPGWWIARHLLGYCAALLAEFWDIFSDKRLLVSKKREFHEYEEPLASLGLRNTVEMIARRAGYTVEKISISEYPKPEAWVNVHSGLGVSEVNYGQEPIDLILTRSLLESTLEQGDYKAFEAMVGQAMAHGKGLSRCYTGLVSAIIWNLLDHLLPATGLAEWALWVLLAVPSYYLSRWISGPQNRMADIVGARLAAAPAELAVFYKKIHDATFWRESNFSVLNLILPWSNEPNLEERAERLKGLSRRVGARD